MLPLLIRGEKVANYLKIMVHGLDAVMSQTDTRICFVLHLSGACVSAYGTPNVTTACHAFRRGFVTAVGMSSFMFNTVLTSNIHHF